MSDRIAANIIFSRVHKLKDAKKALSEKGSGIIEIKRLFGISESDGDDKDADADLTINSEDEVAKAYKSASPEEQRISRCFVVTFKSAAARDKLVAELSADDQIESATPDSEIELFSMPAVPNDGMFQDLWGIQKINAGMAWDCSTGCGQIVAIVDTGIDVNHVDLQHQLWEYSPGRHGINVNDSAGLNDLTDGDGHGTHVAGTVAARGNNMVGVVGVAPAAKLMGMRMFGANPATWSMGANGIYLSAWFGADVINCSWGAQISYNPVVAAAIAWAMTRSQKPVIVAAAGNNNLNASGFYPASDPRVICVGATDSADSKAGFSNWGNTVEVSAPGVNILSTVPGNGFGNKNGTSMAAPHVAGMVALIRSKLKGLTQSEYKDIVQTYVAPISTNVPVGTGRIDLTHLEEILCGCGCSPCTYRSVLENRRLLNAKQQKEFTITSANSSQACATFAVGDAAGQQRCTPIDVPEFAPCFSLSWGDGPSDQLETHDTEILYITVCNPYCNIAFKNLKIQSITITPNAVLPNGEMAVELAASSLICYGDLGPSSCATREFALLINNAAAGSYSFDFEYCIDDVELLEGNRGNDRFDLTFVDS